MSKESFKNFVRRNPSLINYVNNNTKSWQDFYEIYELYGESPSAWNKLLNNNTNSRSANTMKPEEAVKELVTMIKGIDLATVQKGITNIQKTISLVQDLGLGGSKTPASYEARPSFRHFDD